MTPFRNRKLKGQGHQVENRRDRESAMTSNVKALCGRSSHYLQGAGQFVVAPLQAAHLVVVLG